MKRIIRLTESDLTRIVKRVVNESFGSVNNVVDKLDTISPNTDWDIKRRVGRLLHDKITNRDDMDLIYRYMSDLKRKSSEKSKGDEKPKESDSEKSNVKEGYKNSFFGRRRFIMEEDEQVDSMVKTIIDNILQLRPAGASPNPDEAKRIINQITGTIKEKLDNLFIVLRDTSNASNITTLLDDKMKEMKGMEVDDYLTASIAGPNSIKTLFGDYYNGKMSQPYKQGDVTKLRRSKNSYRGH